MLLLERHERIGSRLNYLVDEMLFRAFEEGKNLGEEFLHVRVACRHRVDAVHGVHEARLRGVFNWGEQFSGYAGEEVIVVVIIFNTQIRKM